ncbi:MAG: hypothetical protein PHI27_12680 [Eubacteriales bacterium]|nr:hypothetical protein [Eubacteriales bacterium]MDD3883078.1 hypothetical protein [Eubacteriales bacterium]MDD4512603.1 hypothetical protein [Eubacteriales bacterium]
MTEHKSSTAKIVAIIVLAAALLVCGIIFVPKYLSAKNNAAPQIVQVEPELSATPEA